MANRKWTEGQTTIYKTLSNAKPTTICVWTQILWEDKQILS